MGQFCGCRSAHTSLGYPMTLILLMWMAAHMPVSSLSKIVLSVFEAEWRGRKKSKGLVQL